ncbi:glycosyltransferase family 2 protein [Candidatus Methylobacter oryzae]|uniref:Glycosyltransferase n=1 Tax=Candidatus Methylobacter oryzae TaxID=2497749 RepID=A0ABY3C8P5_9GAMM|nr:glycosyltransferase family 2 protein [Candidatus Methylobacter oryzae]TRW92193.1 glycosyltransferase [Candidatus Methylobacter oryzae]
MTQEDAPLISIIIAVFNGAKTLQHCIDSVAQQTYANKELIIIDGGSKDGTVDLLEANRERIGYWVSEPDRGIYNAWNKGLAQAKGEWMCFFGADDFFWDNQVLERMASQLTTIPSDIRIAYGQIMLLNNEGEELYPIGEPWQDAKRRFKQVMSIPHPGLMHRRSLFEQHGNFDESFRIGGDYELLLRELKEADALFVPGIIVGMRQGGLSSSPANSIESMWDIRRAQKMHGLYLPGFSWMTAMIRVYLRLILWNVIGEGATRKLIDLGRRIKGLPPYWTKT